MSRPSATIGIALRAGGLVAVVVAVLAVGGRLVWPNTADAAAPAPPLAERSPSPARPTVGKVGCSAVACHGGPADLSKEPAAGCWQGSFTRWQAADPHTQAYAALETELAEGIIRGLGWQTCATNEPRCLACHTTPAYANDPSRAHLRTEGVSCEACHGDSAKWLTPHTSWEKPPTDRLGMTDLNDMGVRAKTCAGCHVGAREEPGSPVRDMNHDMIAAGHPRLVFDFAEYHRRLPKHWEEKDRAKEGKPRRVLDEKGLWRVGRVASAEAACEVLASRAGRQATDPNTPWPEFAEFRCVSCHHPIDPDAPAKAGTPRWQSVWPVADVPELTSVRIAMQQKRPNAADVKTKAEAAARALAERQAQLADKLDLRTPTADRDDLVFLLHALAAEQREKGGGDPDGKITKAFEAFRHWDPNDAERVKAEQDARQLANDLLRSR